MMSLAQIHAESARAAAHAAALGMQPLCFLDPDEARYGVRGIPNLGAHTPDGWHLTRCLFVDASGFGEDDEPAMTFAAFQRHVYRMTRDHGDNVGWAIVEAGQFQVYVGQFFRSEYCEAYALCEACDERDPSVRVNENTERVLSQMREWADD